MATPDPKRSKPQTASESSTWLRETGDGRDVTLGDEAEFPRSWQRIGTTRQPGDPDSQELKTNCGDLARKVRDAFAAACSGNPGDQADTQYEAAIASLLALWPFAIYRDRPFRDLLGLLEASLRRRSIIDFNHEQRDAIKLALADLVRWHVDQIQHEGHLERFVNCGIDIEAPIRDRKGKKIRVKIEFVDDD